jgi:hypothetical protein
MSRLTLRLSFICLLALAMGGHRTLGDDNPKDETPPQDRTKWNKSCAEIFALLAPKIETNAKLDALHLSLSSLPDGGVYFSKTGQVVIRPFGAKEPEDVLVFGSVEDARTTLETHVRKSREKDREVVASGDVPLDKMVEASQKLRLGEDAKQIYYSTNPNSPSARAKQRLLGQTFKKVQILVDIQVPSEPSCILSACRG